MEINWIKCIDRMPADDEKIILHDITHRFYLVSETRGAWCDRVTKLRECAWIPFDEQLWEFLNRQSQE